MVDSRRYKWALKWRAVWARSIAVLFGIRIRLEGKVPLDSGRLLVVANHFS